MRCRTSPRGFELHADESWFENLVYYTREQRCEAILQLGDLGYWPRIKRYDDFLRSLPRQLEGADLDLYFVDVDVATMNDAAWR